MSPVETLGLVIILQNNKNTPPNDSKLFNCCTLNLPFLTLHEVRCS